MVQRNYQAPEFRVQDTRQYTSPGVAQADTRVAPDVSIGDNSWRDRLIEGLGQGSAKLLDKMADIEFSNLYLEGQAKVGMIQSEEELQGNPLTRDWKVAGYRDTMGKLALADSEAQFGVDLKTLRGQAPEKMEEYLAERRQKLIPGLSGMSREARAATAGQLLLQDRAAIKQYTSEHAKYIIEQKSQAIHTQWNTSLQFLGAKQVQFRAGDLTQADFDSQLQSTAGALVAVGMDHTLPEDVRKQLNFEQLNNALANGSTELYDYVASNKVPDGKGGSSSIVARLTGEQQNRLAGAYMSAKQQTSDARNFSNLADIANIESMIDANAFTGTYEALYTKLDSLVQAKAIDGGRAASLLNKYTDKLYKNETNSALSEMFIRGDVNGVLSTGKTLEDGAKAMDATLAKNKATPEQRLTTYLAAGKNGMTAGFQKAGEVLGVTIRQVRSPDSTMLPQHRAMFQQINDAVRGAEAAGQTDVRQQLLSGLPEADRMFTQRVLGMVDDNASYDEAVRRATDLGDKEAALSPAVRAANTQKTAQDVTKQIGEIAPAGLMSSMWTWGKAVLGSKSAAADRQLRPWSSMSDRDGWFSDSPTVQFYTNRMREEVATAASKVLLTNPNATADQAVLIAKTNVAARTIQTKFGPIPMPDNVNIGQVFGVGSGNVAAVGPALDAMLKETQADSSYQLAFVNGRMFAQEFSKDGKRVGTGYFIEPTAIKAKIQAMAEKDQGTANERYGLGREVSQNGVSFRYSGMNTAGVPAGWMFNFRSNVVNHEGIKDTPYRDLSGAKDNQGNPIMTVGVGVSSHNEHYPKVGPDGKVSSVDIAESFTKASNDAARAGADVMRKVGLENQAAFSLMSELAYQSGTGFASQNGKTGDRYREFLSAYQAHDVAKAQDAFKRTAAWFYSADPSDRNKVTQRQQNYLRLIEQSFK